MCASAEQHIYELTDYLGRLGCQVDVIDIKGGEQQKEKRQQSSAKYHEVWHPSLPYEYDHPFLQRFTRLLLIKSQVSLFAILSIVPLNRLLNKERSRIVHTHIPEVALATILVSRLRRNSPITVYCPLGAYGLTKFSLRNRIINFTEIPALKWADHIIAITPSVEKWLVSEFNIDPAKITQIYTGGDFDDVKKFLSNKEHPCHQSNIVLCAARICERKNQFTAVKAMLKIKALNPEVKLIFTGPVSEVGYFKLMRDFIRENDLSSCVEFKGEVSRQELFKLYRDAKVFLFPTAAETQGVALVEAMAFGLPVVASNIEPIVDVVTQEEGSAILVNPYDTDGIASAVIHLINDDQLRQTMSEKAAKLGQCFSYENIAKQTLALYEKLEQNEKQN
jgi:glycosyltransferase involved in cell wall biosynthesis